MRSKWMARWKSSLVLKAFYIDDEAKIQRVFQEDPYSVRLLQTEIEGIKLRLTVCH